MSSNSISHNLKRVKKMRLLEKELSEIHSQISLHNEICQQSSKKIESLKRYYEGIYGENYIIHLKDCEEYSWAEQKKKLAKRRLESLEMEKKELRKKVQDVMRRV